MNPLLGPEWNCRLGGTDDQDVSKYDQLPEKILEERLDWAKRRNPPKPKAVSSQQVPHQCIQVTSRLCLSVAILVQVFAIESD